MHCSPNAVRFVQHPLATFCATLTRHADVSECCAAVLDSAADPTSPTTASQSHLCRQDCSPRALGPDDKGRYSRTLDFPGEIPRVIGLYFDSRKIKLVNIVPYRPNTARSWRQTVSNIVPISSLTRLIIVPSTRSCRQTCSQPTAQGAQPITRGTMIVPSRTILGTMFRTIFVHQKATFPSPIPSTQRVRSDLVRLILAPSIALSRLLKAFAAMKGIPRDSLHSLYASYNVVISVR